MRNYLKIKLGALAVIASGLAFQSYSPPAHADSCDYDSGPNYFCDFPEWCSDPMYTCSSQNPDPAHCDPAAGYCLGQHPACWDTLNLVECWYSPS